MRQQSNPVSPSQTLSDPLPGILSDTELHRLGADLLQPWVPDHVQPASVDLTLGNEFIVFPDQEQTTPVDVETSDSSAVSRTYVYAHSPFVLPPLTFCLATTEEFVKIPTHLCGRVEGRSSVGRHGLLIHATAGFIDPGFQGQITLELCNLRNRPLSLRPGVRVAQLALFTLSSPSERPYGTPELGSKYQGQAGVQTSLGAS
jgi:dCTP deaminase